MIVKSHASNGLRSSMESKLEGVPIHRLPRLGCRSRDSVPRHWVWERLVLVQQFFDSADSKENMTFSTLCKAKRLSHSQSFSSLDFSSSLEYFGTLGVHRVRWLDPSLVRFAATNCQAGEILNEKASQWVLSFCLPDCLRDCWYFSTFRYFIVTIFNSAGHPSRASQKVAIVGRTTGRGIAEDREGTT